MRTDTVVTLSLRRWDRHDHARFWVQELAPSLAVAGLGMLAAAAVVAVMPESSAATAASFLVATCALAFPASTGLHIVRHNPPLGYDVIQTEIPAAEYVAD